VPEVILYIASSLDGYIARPDGAVDWLDEVAAPEDGPEEDFGYEEFFSGVGTVLMGRTTYEQILTFDVDYPYSGRAGYVFSRTRAGGRDENVEFVDGADIPQFIAHLKATSDRHIWLIGGGLLIQEFLRLDLVDRIIITVMPVILGEGILLFPPSTPQRDLLLVESRSYSSGMVQLTYRRGVHS
jgi:dihydrofolate reductase